MPVLLFKLNGVPDDEAEDIRELLRKDNIPFYETSAGNWRISLAAIWLHDADLLDRARRLIMIYQESRAAGARESYQRLNQEGVALSFMARVKAEPLRHLLYLLAILVVLYFSVVPFYHFADWISATG